MWRPLFRKEHLKPGDKLRKELLVGEERLWTEYEVLEAGEQGLLLKPLISNGHVHADIPSVYKKMEYDTLHESSTRIWVAMEKPSGALHLKEEMPGMLPEENTLQAPHPDFSFFGVRLKVTNPDKTSIIILVIVLLFFLLIILQVALQPH